MVPNTAFFGVPIYVQVGDFRVSRGPPTVSLTQILCNAVFAESQNSHKAGTLCNFHGNFMRKYDILKISLRPSLLNTAQCPIIGNGNFGPGLVFHFFVDTLYVTYSVLSSIELYPAPPNIQKVPLGKTTEAA